MTDGEKSKTIDNKTEQNKAQYNMRRQTGRILALLSGFVGKHDFLTGKHVLPEKDFLEKAITVKRCERSSLGSEFKNQTDIAKKAIPRIIKKELILKHCRGKNIIRQIYSGVINLLFSNTVILERFLIFLLIQNKNILKSLRLN